MKTLHSIFLGLILAAASLAATAAGKLNINEADAAALAELNGIGDARAEAIIAYRQAHGPFGSVEDLAKVKGIGPAFIDKNRDQLTVGDVANTSREASAN
ncbi:MAG: helix-hairpin-helix domain-containing protein [Gammaproteobacteria bacterium]|nr:helix-hairpin-helix domain-containing protein [Gammaproteobacteria bacterium]